MIVWVLRSASGGGPLAAWAPDGIRELRRTPGSRGEPLFPGMRTCIVAAFHRTGPRCSEISVIFRILGPHASSRTLNPSPGLSFSPPTPILPMAVPTPQPGVFLAQRSRIWLSLEASTCSGWVGASLLPPVGYASSSPCWQHVEMGYLGGGPHWGQIGLPTRVLCKDGDRGGRGWDTPD